MYCVALSVAVVVVMTCDAVTAPEYTKLLPALVTVLLAWMLSVDVPVVKAQRKLALVVARDPVCVSVEAVTTTVMVPVAACTLKLATGDVRELPPLTVTVAVGAPTKTMLEAVAPVEIVVAELNVTVTVAAAPKMKLLDVVVIDAADAVITFAPVKAPAIETPNPADVMVDEATVSPSAEPAPAR